MTASKIKQRRHCAVSDLLHGTKQFAQWVVSARVLSLIDRFRSERRQNKSGVSGDWLESGINAYELSLLL